MSAENRLLHETNLQFFGRMTASISHELKNALAVINENAGLLEDLVLRAEKGIPLENERLRTLSARIAKQVGRVEGIIRNMNRFAHSADKPEAAVDLNEVAALSAALSERLLAMAECTVELDPPEEAVPVRTSPFCLEALIWHCLQFAADHAGGKKALGMSVARSGRGGRIRLTGLCDLAKADAGSFPAERERALVSALGAEIALDAGSGVLELTIPERKALAG